MAAFSRGHALPGTCRWNLGPGMCERVAPYKERASARVEILGRADGEVIGEGDHDPSRDWRSGV
jgi:hypothetical protein